VDVFGNTILLYRSQAGSAFDPIPLRPRTRPPILASSLVSPGSQDRTGVFVITDVYNSRQPFPDDVRIARIRVNRIHVQPRSAANNGRGAADNEVVKGVLGTAPVAADGSVAFRAPAGMPLQLQALDVQGRAVMTMRSTTFLQPGEVQGCAGCHEPRLSSPPRRPVGALRDLAVRDLAAPAYGGEGMPFDFKRIVQPIVDRHCLKCHGAGVADRPSLLDAGRVLTAGPKTKPYGKGPIQIQPGVRGKEPPLVSIAHRNNERVPSTPGDYFTRAGRLYSVITEQHRGRVKLSPDELQAFVDWMDLNGQLGGYESPQRGRNAR
jgi:cytochrome c5